MVFVKKASDRYPALALMRPFDHSGNRKICNVWNVLLLKKDQESEEVAAKSNESRKIFLLQQQSMRIANVSG